MSNISPEVLVRQAIERFVIASVVRTLVADFDIIVDNGEDKNPPKFNTVKGVLSKIMECDEEHLKIMKGDKLIGWIFLVYGNDGWDVISDYTTSLEKYIGATLSEIYNKSDAGEFDVTITLK